MFAHKRTRVVFDRFISMHIAVFIVYIFMLFVALKQSRYE